VLFIGFEGTIHVSSVVDPGTDPLDPRGLGLLDPDPDPLARCMDPDPYIINQNSKKTLISTVL
jgi:hypothetical protein